MRVSNTTHWDLTQIKTWQHSESWSIRLAATHQHPYGDLHKSRASHITRYADLALCRKSLRFPYWLMQKTAARHVVGYSISHVNPIAKTLTAAWSLLNDAHLQAVANSPELTWHGQTIRIHQATLSCDEDSPVWIAQVEIAELADFAAIGIGVLAKT